MAAAGFYFRATDNQVDPTNYDVETGASANYSAGRIFNGFAHGWEATLGVSTRDRTGPTDVRLKGIHFASNNSGTSDYRIDLPATGNYNIRLAMGDQAAAQACRVRFLDTSTQFRDIDANVSAAHWLDATGVDRAGEAAWVSNNAALARTFTSTIFRARFGSSVNNVSSNWAVAALYIEAAAGGGTTVTVTPDDASHGLPTDGATLAQNHVLAAADALHVVPTDAGTLAQNHLLAPADAAHAVPTDGATFGQVHILAPADAAHDVPTDSGTFSAGLILLPDDAAHDLPTDAASIGQVHLLVPADATHDLPTEAATLTQLHVIAVDDALHGLPTDGGLFDQVFILTPADAAHGLPTDQGSIAQVHILIAADAVHLLLSDQATISTARAVPSWRVVTPSARGRTVTPSARTRTVTPQP